MPNRLILTQGSRGGLPFAIARRVQRFLGMADHDFAKMLGISMSTFRRLKKKRGRLSFITSDRLYRMASLFAATVDFFEGKEESARSWLFHPQIALGGRLPIQAAVTEPGSREVEDILGRIEHGICL